ncbi:hypothetical protein DR864_09275 [Runella rosea]|uniref:Uncharacterized protein n=1 Tax=Runella rosea TaxID=2259595 RepID=A0A344TGY8_9BACT|nr:hypothetical protein [Runella rosea]AXE17909.1 hypothetical protein DR864_09275 [Runella rosea]
MKNEFVCVPIADLLKYGSHDINRSNVSGKDVWVLKDNQQNPVAHQYIEEGKLPFQNVFCLMEKDALMSHKSHELLIKAFFVGYLN